VVDDEVGCAHASICFALGHLTLGTGHISQLRPGPLAARGYKRWAGGRHGHGRPGSRVVVSPPVPGLTAGGLARAGCWGCWTWRAGALSARQRTRWALAGLFAITVPALEDQFGLPGAEACPKWLSRLTGVGVLVLKVQLISRISWGGGPDRGDRVSLLECAQGQTANNIAPGQERQQRRQQHHQQQVAADVLKLNPIFGDQRGD